MLFIHCVYGITSSMAMGYLFVQNMEKSSTNYWFHTVCFGTFAFAYTHTHTPENIFKGKFTGIYFQSVAIHLNRGTIIFVTWLALIESICLQHKLCYLTSGSVFISWGSIFTVAASMIKPDTSPDPQILKHFPENVK